MKHNFFHQHFVAGYILICLSIILLLLVYYSSIGSSAQSQSYTPKPVSINDTVYCSFSDKTFCPSQVKFINYVSTDDFSDILQNQTPSPVICSGQYLSLSECAGIKSGLSIKLFEVIQGGNVVYYSRNQYIGFFNTYIQKYGNFKFDETVNYDPGVQMIFENKDDTADLALIFVKNGQSWNLDFPKVSNN